MTILLVEDDPGLRAVARHVLELEGHEVLAANGAKQALALDGEHHDRIEVVVTDNAMPGMWGVEMLEQLDAAGRGLGVVVISGFPAEGGAEGVVWLQKPFSADELAAAVQTARSRATIPRRASAPDASA
jgi:two-component system, cell cycle sensor histidine kinase and response regulator CckA